MKLFLIFILTGVVAQAKIEFKKSWMIPADSKSGSAKIGGLSGCVRSKDKIYFISDDRGGAGGARMMSFPWDEKKSELNINAGHSLLIENNDALHILDLEGIGIDKKGNFLVSNEGDLNKKPRQPAEIFWMNAQGQRIKNVTLSDKFIPEKSGQQTKGLQNNFGFEGLNVDAGLGIWGAWAEATLIQEPGHLYLIEGDLSDTYLSDKAEREYHYPVPQPADDSLSFALGVTDFLYRTRDEMWVLERGVQISAQGMTFDVQLCAAKKNLSKPGLKTLSRDCFYTFAEDAELIKKIGRTANFEGLCWLNEKKTQFMVVSDNNFSKNQNTLFLLYQVD